MHKSGRCQLALLLVAQILPGGTAHGQDGDQTHITAVTVYPGVAMVERVANVSATTRQLSFTCLPASLDAQSLAIKAEHGTQLGEMAILTKPRPLADDPCDRSDTANAIRALEQKKEELTARAAAQRNVQDYVKSIAGVSKADGVNAVNLLATVTAIRTATEAAALAALQIDRQIKAIDKALEPLVRDRDRTAGQQRSTISVTVEVAAAGPDQVHLTYQVQGPGWTPSYRAALDTRTGKVVVERQALVAQATGEDWSKVALTLATGQPGRNTAPGDTDTWRFSLAPPPPKFDGMIAPAPMALAPPPMASKAMAGDRLIGARPPLYDVESFTGNFDTKFVISNPVSVASNGLRVAMSLGADTQDARAYIETPPANGTRAWLMAQINRPAGVLPPGKMSLYRDGAFIGENWYAPDAADSQAIPFGPDDLTLVTIIGNRDNAQSDDRTGTPGQRLISRHYQITNRHTIPISYHVLEATPVTTEVKIRIEKTFEPKLTQTDWQHREGVGEWEFSLDPGKSQDLRANYTISFPRNEKLEDH